ncbi:hypothetical protein C2S53_017429 [Perilla frutescens var. hirtella]|uniref:Uncharacterized protein n=1 Tax=Perilla frutescens var. hirtella TaxID=608512 RepID=A0AAD4IRZ6_PERFH|nr:hypothetical protein C2S53_017429 [Perilla frutescens var. hirtella]
MMLRSASTPALGSLVPSESPGRHTTPPSTCGLVSCNNHAGFQNAARSLVSSPSVDAEQTEEIQRAQSAGNLEDVFNAAFHVDDFPLSRQSSRRLSRKPTLEAILSFFPSDEETGSEAEDEDEDDQGEVEGSFNPLTVQNLVSTHEVRRELNGLFGDVGFPGEGKMYLAAGIGVNAVGFLDDCGFGGGGGGGGSYRHGGDSNRDGGDSRGLSIEHHYKHMLLQSPNNPLFLRNYAHFLYQTKGDLPGAEEYYSRAILVDPEDGDILCQYANVIWELHHDKERAQSYFERAVQASSGESNISASYANFLWEIEGDEDEDEVKEDVGNNPRLGERFFHHGIMASATA